MHDKPNSHRAALMCSQSRLLEVCPHDVEEGLLALQVLVAAGDVNVLQIVKHHARQNMSRPAAGAQRALDEA